MNKYTLAKRVIFGSLSTGFVAGFTWFGITSDRGLAQLYVLLLWIVIIVAALASLWVYLTSKEEAEIPKGE